MAAAPIAKSETIDVIFYYDTDTFELFGEAGTVGDVTRLLHAQSVLDDLELAMDPTTTADRNTYYADVAIVIMDPPGGFGACGLGAKPDSISLLNSESFAYIALDLICHFAFEHLAAHKLG